MISNSYSKLVIKYSFKYTYLEVGVGFEPTTRFTGLLFSRQVQLTALPPYQLLTIQYIKDLLFFNLIS